MSKKLEHIKFFFTIFMVILSVGFVLYFSILNHNKLKEQRMVIEGRTVVNIIVQLKKSIDLYGKKPIDLIELKNNGFLSSIPTFKNAKWGNLHKISEGYYHLESDVDIEVCHEINNYKNDYPYLGCDTNINTPYFK